MTAVEPAPGPEVPALEVPALEVQGLEVVYQRVVEALRGVSLTVPPGAIVALLGPNGAGKTTLLRAVSGLLAVHSGQVRKGRVRLGSLDVTSESSARIVRAGMAQALEGRQLFPALTVEENLRTGAYTRRRSRAGVAESLDQVYALFPKLAERREQAAGYLSGGEQQMVAIGRALMARPRLLVLDEPSLGLAPRVIEEIRTVIVEINQTGTAVLLVEQNAMLALSIADHGYLMEGGRVVLSGSAEALRANPDIQEFYLGLGGSRAGGVDYRQVKRYRRRKGWG